MPEDSEAARPHQPTGGTDVVLDAKGLRALAHPVRVQLIGLLRRHGPATATQLADRTGLTSGATSYHLRQLAAAGFIAEDADRGNARERWWKSLYERTQFNDADLIEQEPEATLGYLQSIAAAYTLNTQQALNAFPTMPKTWQQMVNLSDALLLLTAQETARLQEDLRDLIGRYRRDTAQERANAPSDATRVSLITHVLPWPEAVEPELAQEPERTDEP